MDLKVGCLKCVGRESWLFECVLLTEVLLVQLNPGAVFALWALMHF